MSREKADKEEKKGFKREALSWVICIVVTILLTEFILNFVIDHNLSRSFGNLV